MDQKQSQKLAEFNYFEPRAELFDLVVAKINQERSLSIAKRHVFIYGFGFILALVAVIPAFIWFKSGITNSGFMDFFSLLFSDSSFVVSYWQSFTMSLLESLPILSIIALLSVVWVILETSKLLIRDLKTFFNRSKALS